MPVHESNFKSDQPIQLQVGIEKHFQFPETSMFMFLLSTLISIDARPFSRQKHLLFVSVLAELYQLSSII